MDGVLYIVDEKYHAFFIEELSDELKNNIHYYLSEICFGFIKSDMAEKYPKLYGYEKVVKDFLDRLKQKDEKTQKGMVGEFLTHILIRNYLRNYKVNTPFFNLEEQSIKKGFDLVLINTDTQELWITEVKSGEKSKNAASADEQIKILLNRAKNDLNERLNSSQEMLWQNAINGTMVSLRDNDDIKDVVLDLLNVYNSEVSEEKSTSSNKNVITAAVLFNEISDKFSIDSIQEVYDNWLKLDLFSKVIIIAIQQNTYQEIINYLKSEANSL